MREKVGGRGLVKFGEGQEWWAVKAGYDERWRTNRTVGCAGSFFKFNFTAQFGCFAMLCFM